MRSIVKIVKLSAVAAILSVVSRANAGVIGADYLVITENSPTSLSATWNGVALNPIVSIAPQDGWAFQLPIVNYLSKDDPIPTIDWADPDAPGSVNDVSFTAFPNPDAPISAFVFSDRTAFGMGTIYSNGTMVDTLTVDSNGKELFVTFNDNSAVPETGTTWVEVAFLAALCFVHARRQRHTARRPARP
jgi:hypothetical protein